MGLSNFLSITMMASGAGRSIFFSGSASLAEDPSFIPWLTESAFGSRSVFLFVA